jgi:dimethylargininase
VLLPIPGHPSRIAEQPPIADFLSEHYGSDKFQRMGSECKMDGGDILRLGDIFFVGRSSRTNDAGIAVLRELVEGLGHELRVIDLPAEALHLTSITSTPTDKIIFTPEGYLSEQDFGQLPEGSQIIWMPKEEAYGCNTIGLEGEKVLVAKGYPTVLSTIEELDLKPIVIDMSQIRAADGSLTCLSIFY